MNEEQIKRIFEMLQRQDFADWYNGRFEAFVTGDMEYGKGMTHEQCAIQLKKELQLMLS